MPATLVDPSSQILRSPAMRSWIAVSCSVARTELLEASGAAERGGMGSGVVFSSTRTLGSVYEASDIWVELRVGGEVEERGWRMGRCSRALLMCERNL